LRVLPSDKKKKKKLKKKLELFFAIELSIITILHEELRQCQNYYIKKIAIFTERKKEKFRKKNHVKNGIFLKEMR